MRDFKNIDRLYQENLKDFEVYPPNKAWNAIEKQLEAHPRKRKYPIWLRMASIAAMLLLFFSLGTVYLVPDNNFSKNFLPNLLEKDTDESITDNSDPTETSETSDESTQEQQANVIQLKESSNGMVNNEAMEELVSNDSDNGNAVEKDEKLKPKGSLLADAKSIPLSDKEVKKAVKVEDVEPSRFSLATIYAPIFLSSFGDGSGVDAQFGDNDVSGKSSFSYGVKLAYELTNRISLQTGLNVINLGYRTSNIYVSPGVTVVGFSDLSSTPFLSKSNAGPQGKEGQLYNDNTNAANLNQVFGYYEIPVEIKYNVADGKVGLNLVGGFSTLLLNRDEVFVQTNEFTQSLGSSNNLRSLNFSGNIGLDMDYSLHRNLYLQVSPMFKIQTNTFSKNSGSVLPYYLGVYTGLYYKF